MKGFGEKCPKCNQKMRIERRFRYSADRQVAVVTCDFCNIFLRVDFILKPLRRYRKVNAENFKYKKKSVFKRQQNHSLPLYGRHVADALFGFGEVCSVCGDSLRVRSSRKIGDGHKVIYLKCVDAVCGSGVRAEVLVYI